MKITGVYGHSHLRSDSGMTLIDLCIFLIVLGLLAVPLVQTINWWKVEKTRTLTIDNLNSVDKAIGDFFYAHNRYPCPADITLRRNDPNYGREKVSDCGTPTAPVPPTAGHVLYGSVPFVDLKIPETATFDGWNNRIRYAVSDMQRVDPFNPMAGAIIVNRSNLTAALDCAGTVTPTPGGYYVLVSSGPTGEGAFSADGVQNAACPIGATRDGENCNDDRVFSDSRCQIDTPGLTFYDDLVYSRTQAHSRIWVYNLSDGTDIVTDRQKIGINTNDPFPISDPVTGAPLPTQFVYGVDVVGNVSAIDDGVPTGLPPLDPNNNNGTINVNLACDVDGNNCFDPSEIAGHTPDLDCTYNPTHTAGLAGFMNGDAVCSNIYRSGNPSSCPSGSYATGFDASGHVTCTP